MLTAGVAWSIYSMRGKKATDALSVTISNFMLATIFTIGHSMLFITKVRMDTFDIVLAAASGMGYVIWYAALQR